MIIDKVNKNLIQKFNNVKTNTVIDSNRVMEFFLLEGSYAEMTLPVTKFNLVGANIVVFIDGRKCTDYRYDPASEYSVNFETNSIVLHKRYELGTKVEVWGNIEIPFTEDDGIVLTHEVFCEKQKFTFELPWEYDSLNKSISIFVDGKFIAPSEIICIDDRTVELMTPVEADSTVVFLSRRGLLPDNIYGSYFASLPVGSCALSTGQSVPYGFLLLDGQEYQRSQYKGFVSWLEADGNYTEDTSYDKNDKYILTESTFKVPNYLENGRWIVKVANAYTDSLNNVYIPGNEEPLKKGKGSEALSKFLLDAVSVFEDDITRIGTQRTQELFDEVNNQIKLINEAGQQQSETIINTKETCLSQISETLVGMENSISTKITNLADRKFDNLRTTVNEGFDKISILVQKAETACNRVESSTDYKLGSAKDVSWELQKEFIPMEIMELPVSYLVGTNSLILNYGGFKLFRNVAYQELGNKGELSNQIVINMLLPKGAILNAWVCPGMNDDYYEIIENLEHISELANRISQIDERLIEKGDQYLSELEERNLAYNQRMAEFITNSRIELENAKNVLISNVSTYSTQLSQQEQHLETSLLDLKNQIVADVTTQKEGIVTFVNDFRIETENSKLALLADVSTYSTQLSQEGKQIEDSLNTTKDQAVEYITTEKTAVGELLNATRTELEETKNTLTTNASTYSSQLEQKGKDFEDSFTELKNQTINHKNEALTAKTESENCLQQVEDKLNEVKNIANGMSSVSAIFHGQNLEKTIILEEEYNTNGLIELTVPYIVGSNVLRLSYNNDILYKGIDYEEIGEDKAVSSQIKILKDLEVGQKLNIWSIMTSSTVGLDRYRTNVVQTVSDVSELSTKEDGFYLII